MSLDLDGLQDVYIREFLTSLDCARSLAVLILYENKEYRQIVELEVNPDDYDNIGSFRDALAATSFLAKNKFLDTCIDKESVAMKKFYEAEQSCKETNHRVLFGRLDPLTNAAILAARRKIEFILGSFNAEEFVDSCNWGPGATLLLPRRRSTSPEKFRVERGITAAAYGHVQDWFPAAYPLWDMMFEIQSGNKVITVPKNAKTDRIIAIEPGINLWFQKGIGTMIRRRLRKNGIDLNSQDHNGRLARLSSKFGHLATVDFSSASDTISTEVVKLLLPHSWFCLLDSFRSIRGRVATSKEEISYEKFSSMGNGFTFELESLIFYAVALACCENSGVDGTISVFGDDVILPVACFDAYVTVCKDLGFTINRSKSYSTGYFRESCGSYYYNGRNVKPIFLKEVFNGQDSVIKSANNLRNFAHSRNTYGCDLSFAGCWHALARYLENCKVPRIPVGFGDLGLVVSNDELRATDMQSPSRGFEGKYFKIIAPLAVQKFEDRKGYLLSRLKSIGWSYSMAEPSEPNAVPLPGCVRYSRTRMLVPRWDDIGPWV